MRTGAEYRESLRDGRNVWVMGEGRIDDVTTHPATAAMVDEYVAWYDRHFDPDWQDILLTKPDTNGERRPWAFETPTTSDHLRVIVKRPFRHRLGRCRHCRWSGGGVRWRRL
jgi:4-hydroxyphenylacetate 3-monooxygenase